METKKARRIEQILATDITIEQLAEALWCAEDGVRRWSGCAKALRADNAKLRETVHILAYCMNTENNKGCDGCAMNGKDMRVSIPESLVCDWLAERLREVGVEVDE